MGVLRGVLAEVDGERGGAGLVALVGVMLVRMTSSMAASSGRFSISSLSSWQEDTDKGLDMDPTREAKTVL